MVAASTRSKQPAAGTLTVKQQRFVHEYLKDQNGTQAAIRTGYSEQTAKQQGSWLLADPRALAAVQAGQKKVARKAEVTATMGKGKVAGLLVEKQRHSGTVCTYNLKDISDLTSTALNRSCVRLPALAGIRAKLATERERYRIAENVEGIRPRSQSLEGYILEHWHVLEPTRPLKFGWALRAMCKHLEAVTEGRIQFLLMTVPRE